LADWHAKLLEAGVRTGRNFQHDHESVELTGVDLSDVMLRKAARKARKLGKPAAR
jgi:ubiquinone/menaquinone biosynthesis C-methylase UbiE